MPELKNGLYERFAVEFFGSNNRTEAALAVGYKGQTAQLYGAKLLKVPKVKARIRELQRQAKSSATLTAIERKEALSEIIREPLPDSVRAGERIAAVAELNKMEGTYPPEKHAVLGKVIFEVVHVDRKSRQADDVQPNEEG